MPQSGKRGRTVWVVSRAPSSGCLGAWETGQLSSFGEGSSQGAWAAPGPFPAMVLSSAPSLRRPEEGRPGASSLLSPKLPAGRVQGVGPAGATRASGGPGSAANDPWLSPAPRGWLRLECWGFPRSGAERRSECGQASPLFSASPWLSPCCPQASPGPSANPAQQRGQARPGEGMPGQPSGPQRRHPAGGRSLV